MPGIVSDASPSVVDPLNETGNLAPPPGYLDELTPHIHVTKVDGNTHKSFSFVDFHKILLNFATHLNGNSAGVWFVLAGLLENHGGITCGLH